MRAIDEVPHILALEQGVILAVLLREGEEPVCGEAHDG